jgi:hypothetical protein
MRSEDAGLDHFSPRKTSDTIYAPRPCHLMILHLSALPQLTGPEEDIADDMHRISVRS